MEIRGKKQLREESKALLHSELGCKPGQTSCRCMLWMTSEAECASWESVQCKCSRVVSTLKFFWKQMRIMAD